MSIVLTEECYYCPVMNLLHANVDSVYSEPCMLHGMYIGRFERPIEEWIYSQFYRSPRKACS